MDDEIMEAMKDFAKRVLKGGDNVTSQEVAILPNILGMLKRWSPENNGDQ